MTKELTKFVLVKDNQVLTITAFEEDDSKGIVVEEMRSLETSSYIDAGSAFVAATQQASNLVKNKGWQVE